VEKNRTQNIDLNQFQAIEAKKMTEVINCKSNIFQQKRSNLRIPKFDLVSMEREKKSCSFLFKQ